MIHLINYAMRFVGDAYIYGDKSPVLGGFDCSGFVCEVLRFAGEIGNREVLNAQMLFDKFIKEGTPQVESAGALAFYGKDPKNISHVAFMIDQYRILEAGGGDSSTNSIEEADRRGAMVRGRLLKYRGDFIATIKPRYTKIGLF